MKIKSKQKPIRPSIPDSLWRVLGTCFVVLFFSTFDTNAGMKDEQIVGRYSLVFPDGQVQFHDLEIFSDHTFYYQDYSEFEGLSPVSKKGTWKLKDDSWVGTLETGIRIRMVFDNTADKKISKKEPITVLLDKCQNGYTSAQLTRR